MQLVFTIRLGIKVYIFYVIFFQRNGFETQEQECKD
jgi:hypothetical protein